MEKIAIVTDSTADLPLSYYKENEVIIVPLTVRFGEEEIYRDWTEMNPEDFYQRLKTSEVLPKTSQPTTMEFMSAYKKLVEEGCSQIISVHISEKLSGTIGSATAAKEMIKGAAIEIIDSKQASAALGMIVDALVRARNEGKSFNDLANLANSLSEKVKIFFVLDTLKYLHLGGRIGKAQALVGSLLSIKPVLTLDDGVVAPYKKIRGTARIMPELISSLKESISGKKPLRLGVAYSDDKKVADLLIKEIKKENIEHVSLLEAQIGSVIGTYIGPGAVALFFYEEG